VVASKGNFITEIVVCAAKGFIRARLGSSTDDGDRGASKTNQARYSIRRDVQRTENRGHRGVSGQLGGLAALKMSGGAFARGYSWKRVPLEGRKLAGRGRVGRVRRVGLCVGRISVRVNRDGGGNRKGGQGENRDEFELHNCLIQVCL